MLVKIKKLFFKVWNIRTNAQWSVQTLVGHSGTVRCLHLEGNRLVSGSTDCMIKVSFNSTNFIQT
jgi:F-box/WD-40 domain protein 7